MLLSKQKTILYIHKNGITFYINQQIPGIQFDFTGETIDENLEVIDESKLLAQLATFLKDNNFKPHEAIMLLSEEVVLQKDVASKEAADQRIEVQKFFDEVPFKNIAKLVYKLDGHVQAVATNKTLYETIITILSQYDWKILCVVPIRIFGEFASNDILTDEDIKEIEKQPKLLNQGDLLSTNELSENVSNEGRVSDDTASFFAGKKFYLLLVVLFLIGLGIGSYILPWPRALLGSLTAMVPQVSPTPTTAPTQPPTPTAQPVAKDQLKVQVLNGTGTVGQAGKVKTALIGAGYKTVDTDNASSTDNTTTSIVFDSTVSQANRDEVTTLLEKTFASVSGKTGTPPSGYNIQITTGTEK